MEVSSPVFRNKDWIPKRYTGTGENVSPPLRWSGEPGGCEGFAILCEDMDAISPEGKLQAFVHWIAYNISPTVSALPEGLPQKERLELPVSMDQGLNSFGELGFSGPLPPIGHGKHRYHFKLYALKAPLGIPPGADIKLFKQALKDHVIDTTELVGVYERDLTPSVMI
jgi:hypothetical protein